MIHSLEEGVVRSVIDHPCKKARKYSRRLGLLSICTDPNCNVIAHSWCPAESMMHLLPLFKGLSCFEIAHHEHCEDVFVEIEWKGQKCTGSLRKNPKYEKITNLCSDLKQTEDVPMLVVRRGRPRSEQESANDSLSDVHETPLDRIDVNTAEIISVLSNSPSESVVFAPQKRTIARIQTRSVANAKKKSQSKRLNHQSDGAKELDSNNKCLAWSFCLLCD